MPKVIGHDHPSANPRRSRTSRLVSAEACGQGHRLAERGHSAGARRGWGSAQQCRIVSAVRGMTVPSRPVWSCIEMRRTAANAADRSCSVPLGSALSRKRQHSAYCCCFRWGRREPDRACRRSAGGSNFIYCMVSLIDLACAVAVLRCSLSAIRHVRSLAAIFRADGSRILQGWPAMLPKVLPPNAVTIPPLGERGG